MTACLIVWHISYVKILSGKYCYSHTFSNEYSLCTGNLPPPRNSVVRISDCPEKILAADSGCKAVNETKIK